MTTGYLHPLYAKSLAEFGSLIELPASGGWILERRIPGSDFTDATGCYPLFCCRDWHRLRGDIANLEGKFVSLAAVVDPFSPLGAAELAHCFQLARPFKKHLIVDLDATEEHVSAHHRYYAKRALRGAEVSVARDPRSLLNDWLRLYDFLIQRHRLRGMKAFSPEAFAIQFEVPGLVVFRATRNGRTIGMHLWYLQSGVAYSHLGAVDEEGYTVGGAYALYSSSIAHFKKERPSGIRWIDLGAGAGIEEKTTDGLSRFKRGWATGERSKYFCGSILDPEAYRSLTGTAEIGSGFFPIYRAEET